MEESEKKGLDISKEIKKLLEYPVGREIVYVSGTEGDPVSAKKRLDDIDLKISILIRQVDLILHTIYDVAAKHDDEVIKSLAEKLKRL